MASSSKFLCLFLALWLLFVAALAAVETAEISDSRFKEAEQNLKTDLTKQATNAEGSNRTEWKAGEHEVDDPEEVASMVEMSIGNSTARRNLGFLSCGTGNPIDDCWRCDPNWHRNRKRLADCGIGFGRNAVGGRDGRFYRVTDSSDDDPINPKPGTLRHAVIQDRPLWIVFQRDMVIILKQELIMNSFKTIDGRGANVHIANGACITIQYVTNIIIHGVHIHDCKPTGNAMVRTGGFANLCDECGSAYEQLIFCDKFHLNESGWRECNSCGKRAHCGCIASKSSLELLDSGGVECLRCAKNSETSSVELTPQSSHRALAVPIKNLKDQKMNKDSTSGVENVCELRSTSADCKVDEDTVDKGKLAMTHKEDITNDSLGHIRREQVMCPVKKVGSTCFSDINQVTGGPQAVKQNDREESIGGKDMDERLAHPCLKINLGMSNPGNMVKARRRTSGTPSILMAVYRAERRENKVPYLLQQGQRSRYLLPKPPKASPGTDLKISKDEISELRVPIPPGEGRGQSQLLPRYWPRITDQELQQISGDSNSRIVPLFEKVMSASDASRIGRLVLPKACAEAYFPPISQPEGLPIKIQDAKGKDWYFQFRFWPNNNSRMYVLEGVTPWIQSMQLQAGDTVIFSRREPEGKLVMGFRKSSNATAVQDTQVPSIPDGAISKETFYSGVIKNLPIINGYPALLQSLKGNTDPHFSAFSQRLNSSDGSSSWLKTSKSGDSPIVDFQLQPTLPEMKRSHNIGSKSKRLHIDTDDALELMLTWEEAQDLLQPPPSVKPRIVVIEDQELEEYEEPPVFGKKTIFTSQLSGSSCSAPAELSSKGLDILLGSSRDSKRRRNAGSYKSASKCEASGLNAVAMTAVLCDDEKHQPGCTCLACIRATNDQNPKHERSCMCNVCMTVRFRCQALKVHKKTQSELEVESAIQKEHMCAKVDVDGGSAVRWPLPQDPLGHNAMQLNDSESGQSKIQIDRAKLGKGQIDLKCHPEHKEDPQALMAHVSKMSSLQAEKLPLET